MTDADLIDKTLILNVVVIVVVLVDCFAEDADGERFLSPFGSWPRNRPRQGVGHGDGQAVDQGAAGTMDCFNL